VTLLDIQTTVKLAADDGVVTFDEIRENLRKLNFSDAEIEIFCAKYDRNGDFMFTLDEINAIEEGLEDEMENDGQPINEVDMVPKVSLVTGEKLKEEKLPTPNQGMLDELQRRVDKMERLMGTVANKVNDVLLKLDEFESSGRKLSAKVRQISSANSDAEKKQQMQELVNEGLKEMDKN